MEYKKTKKGIKLRVQGITDTAKTLYLLLDWKRNGNDYDVTITDTSDHRQKFKTISGFQNSTLALHEVFDYFELVFAKKQLVGSI